MKLDNLNLRFLWKKYKNYNWFAPFLFLKPAIDCNFYQQQKNYFGIIKNNYRYLRGTFKVILLKNV